jgi:DNA-binding response OmpR family regulator/anti-sigma regulatory factor (Ser/Thr protein kinase)
VIKTSEVIERNGENLLRLVNQLLDLSKLEDQSFKLQLQNADIVPFLRYVTESFQSFANGKNLRLSFFSSIKTLSMDYDPEQVTQVMTNLISNALKFTKSGGEINVELEKENDFLMVSVSDTGIGIPQENLDNIFDRFYQVDDSTTRANEGTGIGLAHSVELVKLMKGEISVESELGKGSTFKVRLKIHQNAKSKDFSEKQIEQADFIRPINLNSSKDQLAHVISTPDSNGKNLPQILIIEDNVDVIHYLKACLENLYQISIALNGKIGIEKALEAIPDIIISDVMMPEKDGYEVCNTLKNDERTSHIPIILITAKADVASKIEGLSRGADAYLPKPFDRKELIVRLAQMVEKKEKLTAYFSKSTLPKNELEELNETIEIEDVFVQKVKKIVEENHSKEDFGLPQLCQKIGMSRSQLFRKMKALTDKAPSEYIRSFRLQKAKHLLETNDFNVSEVAYEVGFKDPSYFSKLFQKEFGELPRATRK